MQVVAQGYRGLSLVLAINSDRIFSVATVGIGLVAGAFIGTMLLGH